MAAAACGTAAANSEKRRKRREPKTHVCGFTPPLKRYGVFREFLVPWRQTRQAATRLRKAEEYAACLHGTRNS